jgi:hypothetical protein
MNIRRGTLFLCLSAGLTACVAAPTVSQDPSGAYIVGGHGSSSFGGLLNAQFDALEAARDFCDARDSRYMAIQDGAGPTADGMSYVLRFRCRPNVTVLN